MFCSCLADDITVVHVENDESEYLEYLKPIKNLKMVEMEKGWLLSTVLYYNEGPADLGSMIPQYMMSKNLDAAKTPVLLTAFSNRSRTSPCGSGVIVLYVFFWVISLFFIIQ